MEFKSIKIGQNLMIISGRDVGEKIVVEDKICPERIFSLRFPAAVFVCYDNIKFGKSWVFPEELGLVYYEKG